jgi:hypothetical protein
MVLQQACHDKIVEAFGLPVVPSRKLLSCALARCDEQRARDKP